MNIFDYLFYRTYLINKNYDNAPFCLGIIAVWWCVETIIIPLEYGFTYLFYFKWQNERLIVYPIGILIICLLTWRYKKKKENIFKRYENCSLNEMPNWLFGILAGGGICLCGLVSFYILKNYVEPFMWKHDLMGCFHDYLPSFMILD